MNFETKSLFHSFFFSRKFRYFVSVSDFPSLITCIKFSSLFLFLILRSFALNLYFQSVNCCNVLLWVHHKADSTLFCNSFFLYSHSLHEVQKTFNFSSEGVDYIQLFSTTFTTKTICFQGCLRVRSRGDESLRQPCKFRNLAIFYHANFFFQKIYFFCCFY